MELIRTLEKVAVACGNLALALQAKPMEHEDKNEQLGAHFSTRADRQSQELGLRILAEEQPGEVVIAEEGEHGTVIPTDCVVFDPLDGTSVFFNGIQHFAVSLCAFREGRPACSATYFPGHSQLISAVRGRGCYVGGFEHGKRIGRIDWHGRLDKTLIGTDVGAWTVRQGTFDTVLRPLASRFNIASPVCATEGARQVLFGHIGAFYNLGIAKVWDAAGMALAIEEAGGVVCGPDGRPVQWNTVNCDWIVAGRQELADIVLEHSRNWKGRE